MNGDYARKLIRQCLERCSAINEEGLLAFLDMDGDVLAGSLNDMIAEGKIEVLRPLSLNDSATIGEQARKRQYYRLIRETDRDYEWEQECTVRLPLGRLLDVRQQEAAAGCVREYGNTAHSEDGSNQALAMNWQERN